MDQYTVLFVDDEPHIISALVRVFRSAPIKTLTAPNAEAALQIVRAQSIAVVVADNLMPGMTGVELVRKIKDCSPDTIRILLSGHSDLDAVLHALNDGEVFRFLLKPWAENELRATVNLALAHYHLTARNRDLMAQVKTMSSLIERLRISFPDVYDALCTSTDQTGVRRCADSAVGH